ncbi:tRNA pseudouridine(55) synthase TruB [soil metagenome]
MVSSVDGIVVVDKPAGLTSHDVVARLRRALDQKRIGHSGTLDPDATGVLVIGVGRATRLLRFLTTLAKCYEGEVVLGTETSTLDAGGDVTATHLMDGVSLDEVRRAAAAFVGEIEQIPQMVSAVKVGGRRLHELARAGLEVERAPRPVTVWRLDVEPAGPGVFRMAVECSSGTYVRTLAADLGRALGGGAHLRNLRRTAVGSFGLGEARPLDESGPGAVLPPAEAMRDDPAVAVGDATAADVVHGRVLAAGAIGSDGGPGPWAVLDARGNLLAVYERHHDGRVKPAVVLSG